MKQIRLGTGPTALFGALFLAALILLLPMRLALGWIGIGDMGLSARRVTGSVWAGSLDEAHAGQVGLGDLRAHLSPIRLLIGRARVGLASRGDAAETPLQGAVSLSRHAIGLDDLSASVAGGSAFAPLPLTALDLDEVSAHFQDGSCQHAEGRVRATLAGSIGAVALPQSMSGAVRCDGDALLVPLASAAGTESLTLRLRQDGGYAADLTMRTSDPALATKLQLAGFQLSPDGYLLSIQGGFE